MAHLKDFYHALIHALKNLIPIIAVVLVFQAFVLRTVPDNSVSMAIGIGIVAIGVALFLQGLELSIFPVGKSLSNQFARKGSVPILLALVLRLDSQRLSQSQLSLPWRNKHKTLAVVALTH